MTSRKTAAKETTQSAEKLEYSRLDMKNSILLKKKGKYRKKEIKKERMYCLVINWFKEVFKRRELSSSY